MHGVRIIPIAIFGEWEEMIECNAGIIVDELIVDLVAHLVMVGQIEVGSKRIEVDADGGGSTTAGFADDLGACIFA